MAESDGGACFLGDAVSAIHRPTQQAFGRVLIIKADVESGARLARDHIGGGIAHIHAGEGQGRRIEMGVALVQRLGAQLGHKRSKRGNRIDGFLRIAHMPLHAGHRHLEIDRAAPAYLQRVAGMGHAGGLAHHAMIDAFAPRFQPCQQFRGAVDGGAFLVARDQ